MSCELCGGIGLIITQDERGQRGRDCACRIARVRAAAVAQTGIPPRYQQKTFEEFDGSSSKSVGTALLLCRRFVEEWPVDRKTGMLLTGPVGVGKTHLAAVALMECGRRYGATIAFVNLAKLFSDVKATFDSKWMRTEREILAPLLESDIVAIDEVGAARHSEWNFAMTELIINTRYDIAKSTIFTTNFANQPHGYTPPAAPALTLVNADKGEGTFAQMAQRLSSAVGGARQETLGDRIGPRMFSRAQEMCRHIAIDGEDRRAEMGQKRRQG